MRRRRAVWWTLTVALGSITAGAYLALALRSWAWDWDEACASRLGVSVTQVGAARQGFPPQLACARDDLVVFTNPLWTGPALVVALGVTVLCLVVAMWHVRVEPAAEGAGLLVVVGALVVTATLGWAGYIADARGVAEAARQRVAAQVPQLPGPVPAQPVPTATSTASPRPASASRARADVVSLGRKATQIGGDDLIWPLRPTITQTRCVDGGRAGTVFFLKARFTTRDPDDVHGPAEMGALSRDNERIAGVIVDAWVRTGLVAGPERLHGEWHLGIPAGSPLDTVQVGFTDGIGDLSVASRCAVRR